MTPPKNVTDLVAQWQAKHPDWRIEVEPRWFIRAYVDKMCVEATHKPHGDIQ